MQTFLQFFFHQNKRIRTSRCLKDVRHFRALKRDKKWLFDHFKRKRWTMPKEVVEKDSYYCWIKKNLLIIKTDFFFQKMTCEFLRIINSL